MPGGVITWKVYEKYKSDEKRNREHDALLTLLPRCVESPIQQNIIMDFLTLLMKIAEKEKKNGLNGRKLARLAGFWAFDLSPPNKETPTNFGEGLACWSVAAEASYHMFLAYIRTQFPKPGLGKIVTLPKILETMLLNEPYPPKPLYETRLTAVPKITLFVGRLSSDPFVLLHRVAKTIRLDDPSKFASQDDYQTLYTLFNDKDNIESQMSPESRRVLEEISKSNGILSTDHTLKIKDTVRLSYDVRGKTWSKYYNNAFVDPVTGEPHRPLTNYVYPPNFRTRIEQSQRPYSERPSLPYPPSPPLNYSKPLRAETWKNAKDYYEMTQDDKQYANLESWHHQRKVEEQHKVNCILSRIDIDDFFAWVWMCSLSPEQTEVRKALFGRSLVVEVNLGPGKAGLRWVVVEEVLVPKPPPMKPKANISDLPFEYRPPATTKTSAPKTKEKKPVRFEPPAKIKAVKPASPKPPAIVYMPEPEPEEEEEAEDEQTTIRIHYDNMDPLVAAVAERLKKFNSDHETQTNVSHATQTDGPPKPISADDGNNKGVQADVTEGSTIVPQVSVDHNVVTDIPISPTPEAETKIRQPRPSSSYEEVINAIPYLNIDDSTGDDCMVTPILTNAPQFHKTVSRPLNVPKRRERASPPINAEHFVVSIDSSHEPSRRVVSMPVYPAGANTRSRYRGFLKDSDESNSDNQPTAPIHSHRRSNSSLTSIQRAMHQPMSSADREARQAMEDGLWTGDYQTPRMEQGRANLTRPMGIRDASPATSDSSTRSNLRVSWGYGRENQGISGSPQRLQKGQPHWEQSHQQPQVPGMDKRVPKIARDARGGPSRRPQGESSMPVDARQIPRDFQSHEPETFDNVPRGFTNRSQFPEGPSNIPHQFGNDPRQPQGSFKNPPHPYRAQATNLSPVNDRRDVGDMAGGPRPFIVNRPHPGRGGMPGGPAGTHASPDSYRELGYGSDTNYRYDPNERAKASPDSGYAVLPVRNSQRNLKNNMAGNDLTHGSDSDVSRGSIGPSAMFQRPRSNSNMGMPPRMSTVPRQSQQTAALNLEHGEPRQHHNSISPQVRPALDYVVTQPGSVNSPLGNNSSVKEVGAANPTTMTSHGAQSQSASLVSGSILSGELASPTQTVPASTSAIASPVQPCAPAKTPHQSFGTRSIVSDSQSLSSGGSQASKWSEVKSNLSAMSQSNLSRGTGDQPKIPLPAVIEAKANPQNPTSVNTLFGTASPEDYLDATVKVMRRPSINTGDHVKNIVVNNNHSSQVIGSLPTAQASNAAGSTDNATTVTPPKASGAPTFSREGDGSQAFFDPAAKEEDDEDDSDNDFMTAFPPNKHDIDIYKYSPPLPKNRHSLPAPPPPSEELYQSTQHGLRGGPGLGYSLDDHTVLLAQENARGRAVSSGNADIGGAPSRKLSLKGKGLSSTFSSSNQSQQAPSAGGMGGLSRSYTQHETTHHKFQSEPRKVSRFSITGIVNAVSEKKKKKAGSNSQ